MKILITIIAICAAAQAYVPLQDNKIVGGEQVTISDAPYQVSVRIYDDHVCGGSIINDDSILTAAHCVYGVDAELIGVRVGNSAHSRGQYIPVLQVITHSTYDPEIMDKDLAILKLEILVTYSDTVHPIELQPKGLEVPTDSSAWMTGWGVTSQNWQITPSLLRGVEMRVTSFEECSYAFGNGAITSSMLCADNFMKGACNGDAGGPLVFNEKLIGVTSWGFGCAKPQFPQVYAKVSNMYDWIVENAN